MHLNLADMLDICLHALLQRVMGDEKLNMQLVSLGQHKEDSLLSSVQGYLPSPQETKC